MDHDDLRHAQWRKSSYSGNTGNCLEVAATQSVVGIRDSKDPDGAVLRVSREAWQEFSQDIRSQ